MKKIIIYAGILMLFVNTLSALLFGLMTNFNMFVSDLSIIVSILLIRRIKEDMASGLKIGLTSAFLLFGITRFIFCLFAPNNFFQNWALLVGIILVCLEFILLLLAEKLNQK